MRNSFRNSIDRYLRSCKESEWISAEAYKFEFANFVNNKVEWSKQSDDEILEILIDSQKIKYADISRGIQFIQKSGRVTLSEFLGINDIQLFRKVYNGESIESIKWEGRTMSFTGLSAWLSSLFPDIFYPAPFAGINETCKYLFDTTKKKFPKVGLKYIVVCQKYMAQTEKILRSYPVEEIYLDKLNEFYRRNTLLEIKSKDNLQKVDWVWIVQDFHLFVFRKILKLYQKKGDNYNIQGESEPTGIEGSSSLATHMRLERNSGLIKKIKTQAILENKMLNCEVCGFSFWGTYGQMGEGFIEAHHINPLSERKEKKVTSRKDIALVCSNCHRMLHKGNPVFTLDELREAMKLTKGDC